MLITISCVLIGHIKNNVSDLIGAKTTKEKNVVRMWAAVCEEERCVTRLKTAARETTPYVVVAALLKRAEVHFLVEFSHSCQITYALSKQLLANQMRVSSVYQNAAQNKISKRHFLSTFYILPWFKKSNFRENENQHRKRKWTLADQNNVKKKMASVWIQFKGYLTKEKLSMTI